jgi:hypothetical protein
VDLFQALSRKIVVTSADLVALAPTDLMNNFILKLDKPFRRTVGSRSRRIAGFKYMAPNPQVLGLGTTYPVSKDPEKKDVKIRLIQIISLDYLAKCILLEHVIY